MKVALFVNSAKTFFWHRKALADKLVKEGHKVYVICSKDGDVSRFKNEPYETIFVDLSRKGKNPFSDLLLFFRLYSIFKKISPDVAHNFTIKCVIYGSLAQKLAKVPTIINSITGLGIVFVKGGLLQFLVEQLYRVSLNFSGSKVIFQNPDDRELFLQKKLVRPEKVSLILGSGVNTDIFRPLPKDTEPTIVFASRLLKSKGVLQLLEVSERLIHSKFSHRLVIAGEPDSMSPDSVPEAELEHFRKLSHVSFLGNVNNVHEILNRAHIACFPSVYREGIPKFLLEALASGMAIVTTDMPGCREVVQQNGALVKPLDSEGIFCALSAMLENRYEIEKFGRSSRELALRKFSEKIILKQILDLYC